MTNFADELHFWPLTLTESQSKLSCLTLDRATLEWELVSHSFLSGEVELFV